MNVRHLLPSVSRRLLSMGSLMLAAGLSKFRRIEPQYIAASGARTRARAVASWTFTLN
jgi:hypothetical protein